MTTTTLPGCYTGCTPPHLGNAVFIPPPAPTPPHIAVAHAVGQLPFTGADILTLLLIGVAAVTIGIALVRHRRAVR